MLPLKSEEDKVKTVPPNRVEREGKKMGAMSMNMRECLEYRGGDKGGKGERTRHGHSGRECYKRKCRTIFFLCECLRENG